MIGRVVSVKMKNTVVVLVEYLKTHPLYKKTYLQSKKFLVDDALAVSLGDMVEIVPTRPVSKNKHFKVAKVIGRDITGVVGEQLKKQAEEVIAEVMPGEEQELGIKNEELSEDTEKDNKNMNVEKKVRTREGTSRKSK